MTTFYTEEDLVLFGRYLLSDKRTNSIENKKNLTLVHYEDIVNWKEQYHEQSLNKKIIDSGINEVQCKKIKNK